MVKSFDHINRQLQRFFLVLLALAWSPIILADNVTTWSALQNAMKSNNTITLGGNITAAPNETHLEVPEGVTVTLNLNGRTIDRGLGNNTEGIDDGLVIKNLGTLTIIGSGTITGGNNNGEGGGIYNKGTLNLNDVNVTNNKAKNYGGGIRHRSGVLNITGGSITGNIASIMHGGGILASESLSITDVVIQNNTCGESGGGIFCYTGKTLTISGSNTISDNIRGSGTRTSVNNVYLQSSAIITVAGNIGNSIIGVQKSGVFTSGLSGNGTAANFTSDNPTYAITLNGSGEAQTELIDNWTTLKAAIAAGGKIKLASNCTRSSDSDGDLTISNGKEVELDLNSCTINGGNINSHIFMVYGDLTINDTGGNGRITGGNVSGTGGAIWASNGEIVINGGTITGNTANGGGGGIYHAGNGGITINGGSITGNIADNLGGGIYLYNGYLTINGGSIINNTTGGGIISFRANNQITISSNSGKVTIQNNKAKPTDPNDLNLQLKDGQNITIGGALTTDSRIGIIIANDAKRAFTSGLKNKGTATNFTADYNKRAITLNSSGEAQTNTVISSAEIADISTPVAGQTLDYSALCITEGVGSNSVIWKRGSTNLGNNATATAGYSHTVRVTLTPSDFYAFTSSSTATINGNSASVTLNDGKLVASYAFPTTTKVTPTITTVPTASDITYGQTLASSNLTDGAATVAGTFAWTTPTTKPANAGDNQSFGVTFTPTDETNYNTRTTNASVNVGKAPLTITANNHTITYGDEPNNAEVSYTGFVNSETSTVLGGSLVYAYSYSQYGDVDNNYTITPSGLTSSNYDITFNAGTLTVEQKEVGLNWTNTSFTYDKTVKTPTVTATGMVNGDEIGVTVTGGQTNAGNHTATASELTGTKNGNYKLPSSKTQAFSISKAEITVSGITAENKTYDKTTNATLVYTAANLAGKIEGDNLSVSATGTFADENIGTGKNVTISTLTLGGTSVGNYQLAGSGQQSYTTANITAKTVGLNWSDTSFDYNGSPWAPTAEATGVIAGDVCNVTVEVDREHSAVGSYTAEATALDNGNYALPAEKTHDYEIVRPMTGIEFSASKHWNTYYAFENLATPTGIKAYIVTGVSGTTATTSEIGYIPKDVGVLLYSASAGSGFKASAYTGAAGSFTSNKLNGSTTTTDLDSEAGYILYGDAFVLTTGGTLPANRCYLPANMGAGTRSLTIDGGDGTTSLYKVNSEEMGDDKWFDLQGQRIEKPQKKGLYINDGKKVVIK